MKFKKGDRLVCIDHSNRGAVPTVIEFLHSRKEFIVSGDDPGQAGEGLSLEGISEKSGYRPKRDRFVLAKPLKAPTLKSLLDKRKMKT